ncbi:MAG: adenylate/guanylate cyclase domain-containing protein, partial [Candidatus Dadabacteria bacterium]
RQRRVLLSYLPSPAIDRMLDEDEAGRGRKAEAAVLFSDLRGFTSLSERVDPIELVEWMDAFFSRATATVLDELGMVDKLIGDAVLAVFGIPEALENPAERAVRCAFRLDETLQQLVRERPIGGVAAIRMGIGVHYGPLVAGSIGSDARRTFTVFGDTVNTASRLEGMTKTLGRDLIISEPVYEQLSETLRERFEPLGRHDIRGRTDGLFLYGCALRG